MRTLSLLALILAAAAAARPPDPVLAAHLSGVQIVLEQDGEREAVCSGAVVRLSAGARVLSAGHCVSEAPQGSYLARDSGGRVWPLTLERWEHEWPKADYAVFTSPATAELPALIPATRTCQVGDDVYSWSGPLGLGLMLFGGQLSGQLSAPYEPEMQEKLGGMFYSSNWMIAPGASGSVALNDAGEAVGILVGTWNITTKLAGGYFVPLPD